MKACAALTMLGLVACATTPKAVATDVPVMADARKRSAAYCSTYKDGCEVTTRRTDDGGWTALVVPVFWGADGKRVFGIDMDDFYIYDDRGRFESALRGY